MIKIIPFVILLALFACQPDTETRRNPRNQTDSSKPSPEGNDPESNVPTERTGSTTGSILRPNPIPDSTSAGGSTTGSTTTSGSTTGSTTGSIPGPIDIVPVDSEYKPIGVGGGGAMSGVAFSPYANLWFIGTDMGTLFRSTDLGLSWQPINHHEAVFSSELPRAVSPGFAADGLTVFHAAGGMNPKRSSDGGVTFAPINLKLPTNTFIKYWHSHSENQNLIFAATTHGLYRSTDKGVSFSEVSSISEESVGTFIDYSKNKIYHATKSAIWVSTNSGSSFQKFFTPKSGLKIRQFTGGRDAKGITLAFLDNDGKSACSWAQAYVSEEGSRVNETYEHCGYIWISKTDNNAFIRTNQIGGDHLKMAENDSKVIYVTGGRRWIRQYGTKIFVSEDQGNSWNLKLQQINWDVTPFEPWPENKIEYSAAALDIGWWDDGYESFDVNRRNSQIAGGCGYFFFHATSDTGEKWKAPFTKYADMGTPAAMKAWKTRGIEVISIYKTKFHPRNPQLLYAASADIAGLVSEDKGKTFRITKAGHNSNYDYSFDLADEHIVYAAAGNSHDYPNDWHANPIKSEGGIYISRNRGYTWKRLTPSGNHDLNRQYLSVVFDPHTKYIYGGSHETGIIRSTDNGKTWKYFNSGLPSGSKVIPQMEVDPKTGNVYALLTGDKPDHSNLKKTGIYFLDVEKGSSTWQLLRTTVHYPPNADPGYKLWYYPTRFAIDFDDPNTLWMSDYENAGNWLMTGIWKSTDKGENWHRMLQMTHPTDITIDPNDRDKIHVSGYYQLDGKWGNGGQMYSNDGGKTWKKNEKPPLQQNARSVTLDPTNPTQIIYSYFGGGMLIGPNPNR